MRGRTLGAVLLLALGFGSLSGGSVAHACDTPGSELLGFPSRTEAGMVPAEAASMLPAAAAAAPTPVTPPATKDHPSLTVLDLDLGDLDLDIEGLDVSREELLRALEGLDLSALRLAYENDLLAGETVAPVPPAKPAKPVRPARPARPARAERGHGWSYEEGPDEDAAQEVRTDTTISVRPGMVFMLENFGGSIDVKTWSKNAVRVRAMHGKRNWVALSTARGRLDVSSQARMGVPGAVDYQITMPAWMNAKLSGVYNDVTAEGLEGGITVETVSGDIKALKVAGDIALRSVQGTVLVENAKGNLQVSSVNDGVRVVNADGVVAAEAVNGDIQLVDLRSKTVMATTVSGEVVYSGTIQDDGDYSFSTHNGDIALALSDAANATVSVATFSGEFESPYPVRIKKVNKDKRFYFTLGSGKAKVSLESFDGAIQLFRPDGKEIKVYTMSEWLEREKERKERAKEHKQEHRKSRGAAQEDDEDPEEPEDDE